MGAHPREPEPALGIANRLAGLPEPARRVLLLASCLGPTFELVTLALACGQSADAVVVDLQPGLAAGLLRQEESRFAFRVPADEVYALVSAGDLPELHLSIGRRLLAEAPGHDAGHLQLAAQQLGRGARLLEITHTEAQRQLALHQKLAALGTLTAGVVHDIKNPLNFVNNFAELSESLSAELADELAHSRERLDPDRAARLEEIVGELVQNISRIRAHGDRAGALVQRILEHSRSRAGQPREVDLNSLVRAYARAAIQGRDDVSSPNLEVSLDEAMGPLRAVPEEIGRVVVNLVSNALYAAEAHRAARGDSFAPLVRVSTRDLTDRVEVRVRDNGAGIPEALRGQVYTPFFTTKPAGEGTGLGLSLSQEIVVQGHGGSITFECEDGAFTEFVVTLPRRP
jgi:signal transduction histidine kinase